MLKDISKQNAERLGTQTLIFQTIEECGELIKALSKLNRVHGIGQVTETSEKDAMKNVVEEIADVEICIEQLKYLMTIDMEQAKNKALKKVDDRLK